jgi:hypothetical protein
MILCFLFSWITFNEITAIIFASCRSAKEKTTGTCCDFNCPGCLCDVGRLCWLSMVVIWAARFVRYPEFGISIPIEYSIHGIDVSKYQQMIAWDAVSSMQVKKIKLGFVFYKSNRRNREYRSAI